MKCAVLYIDGFAEFEIIIAVGNLAAKAEIVGIALENRPYISEEKQTFLPDTTLAEVSPDDFDLLIIPGGDFARLPDNKLLNDFISGMHHRKKIIGAICGGTLLLGKLGILDHKNFTGYARGYEFDQKTLEKYFPNANYTGEDVVVDGNIVTAQGQAFVEFGVEIYDLAGFYETREEKENELNWLRNKK